MKDIFSNIEQQIENIDAKIESIVKDATDSKNYEKLNQKINDMVNSSTSAFEKGYARAEKVVKEQSDRFKKSYEVQQENIRGYHEEYKKPKVKSKELFAKKDGVYAGGVALTIIGFILTGLLSLGSLAMWILHSALPGNIFLSINQHVFAPLIVIFLLVAFIGLLMSSRVRRFRKYIQVLAGDTQVEVSELASSVGKSVNFIRRDLKSMIATNWFKEGYLTHDGQVLIISKAAYEEYKVNQQYRLEAEQRQEQIRQMHEQLPVQARAIIGQGEDFIKAIHGNKVAISEYDLTIKLSHLESILKKIFKRVEKHPEVVPQMRKMMDYYLPTTIKLLEAYVQLDKQAIQGVNILSAKTEIEESIDTLTLAYEKLLDDLFEDIMIDVSTDISVLNTMLAQDGLTNGDFENMDKRGAE